MTDRGWDHRDSWVVFTLPAEKAGVVVNAPADRLSTPATTRSHGALVASADSVDDGNQPEQIATDPAPEPSSVTFPAAGGIE
ncbi:MAG TPA: hypothetical protein VG253_04110 [Streptosporangiaceae bacterium]|nr:hypothetical protein [Streptosporangiaceae bacterium]